MQVSFSRAACQCSAGIGNRRSTQRRSSARDAECAPQSALDAARTRLEQDPSTQARLQRIDDAQRRVLELQAAQQQIQTAIQAANSSNDGGSSSMPQQQEVNVDPAAVNLATAADEVSSAARNFSIARAERDAAQDEQRQLRANLQKDEDRLQSGLAGAVAAAGGLLVQAPLVAGSHQQGIASLAALATVVVTSALFGVVWRHTIRSLEDAADVQLKGGCIAAFGLTSGLGQANVLLRTAVDIGEPLSIQLLAQAALCCGASMLQFAAAAALLEVCMARQVISRSARLP